MRYRFWKSANVWRLAFGRRFHAGEVVGFAHGEPPFRHLGLGVALSAVHDRSAMGLVTGGAFQLFVMGPMGEEFYSFVINFLHSSCFFFIKMFIFAIH